ncbi:aminotransferase class III-fold pyridoxal phosphate-dependent enzyme [Bordetella petrii]|uniref:aminotransferase class III-fold pyridoxal phosphate-dependent enzyme n=1 Tax=Bordetella petrii TaxID=94624 RepID=UPI001E471CDE|nr:aminotransferase class III-fold pyridoxal phosphate-dependent enzyme [Bordetella petrii]MCD0503610.1 aminotransferase class III-fold pyridoxal phosphate-dependent enzyme [Bordetella petrii]
MTHIFHRLPRKPPAVALRGEGSFLFDASGRRYYDGSGGAAVSCLGHAHPEVVEAVIAQVRQLEYAHTSFFSSPPAEELAELLARQSPQGLDHVYFLSSGSEAVETALKMARQYHVERGEAGRRHNIARWQSYHGNTLGALAIGGNRGRRALYQPLLPPSHHVSPCFARHYRQAGESDDAYGTRLAHELEQTILALGPDTVSAFIAEIGPRNARGGALLPHREYSVASLPADGAVHLLVRQMRGDDGQLGLGSGWLTQLAEVGDTIDLRLRANPNFHPPADARPVLLIGNGTGLAGLRALLKARIAAGHVRNWLVFGERRAGHDWFHRAEIEAWLARGQLQRLDAVFSRDTPARRYVQHALLDAADSVRAWVDAGSDIYVCGSLHGMAQGVDDALAHILGSGPLAALRGAGRYRRDVY